MKATSHNKYDVLTSEAACTNLTLAGYAIAILPALEHPLVTIIIIITSLILS